MNQKYGVGMNMGAYAGAHQNPMMMGGGNGGNNRIAMMGANPLACSYNGGMMAMPNTMFVASPGGGNMIMMAPMYGIKQQQPYMMGAVPGVGVVLDTVLDGSPKSRRITLLRFCCGCGRGCGCGCCSLPKSKRRLGDGEARGLGGRGGGVEEEEVSKGTAAAVLFDGV